MKRREEPLIVTDLRVATITEYWFSSIENYVKEKSHKDQEYHFITSVINLAPYPGDPIVGTCNKFPEGLRYGHW
jgi:hypothetical protein